MIAHTFGELDFILKSGNINSEAKGIPSLKVGLD